MSGPQPGTPISPADRARRERTRRIAIWAGVAVLAASVVAAGFWLSGGSSDGTASPAPTRPQVSARDGVLQVGDNPDAATRVVVYQDFAAPDARAFDLASREYLRQDAAAGRIVVEYHPFALVPGGYGLRALTAWGAVARHGTAEQALGFRDLLFDRQPAADDPAPGNPELTALAKRAGADQSAVLDAIGTPDPAFLARTEQDVRKAHVDRPVVVLVDGSPITAASPEALAERLETLIARS